MTDRIPVNVIWEDASEIRDDDGSDPRTVLELMGYVFRRGDNLLFSLHKDDSCWANNTYFNIPIRMVKEIRRNPTGEKLRIKDIPREKRGRKEANNGTDAT